MSLHFKSLRSSSGGNCVQIWTKNSQIIIDCGFKAQWECEKVLRKHAGRIDDLDAVLVSHSHTDHIHRAALAVLSSCGVRIRAHRRVVEQICARHGCADWDEPPLLQAFSDGAFQAGDFRITPFEVPHDPQVPNFGFVVCHGEGKRRRKIVVCTDFHNYDAALRHFTDADFIFVEANHDPDLLKKYPNDASWFHLSNPKTAWLLYHAIRQSDRPPQAVMLGHLSDQRNREKLALKMVERIFDRQHMDMDFDLSVAPMYEPSKTIRIE